MIGENIKKLRESRKITQKELAEAMGFSYQNISKWENDVSMPDIPTALALAKYFGVSTDTLLGNAPERAELCFAAAVNAMNAGENFLSVWTDFIYNGTVAPPAHKNEGRRRTSEAQTHRASAYKAAIAMGVNASGKICTVCIDGDPWMYSRFYFRTGEKNSCIRPNVWNKPKWPQNKEYEMLVPSGGFLILVPIKEYTLKQIFKFILPENSFADFCIPNEEYKDFLKCLANGELDNIDVRLDGENIVFSKETDFVNPLYDNIDRLTELVRARTEKTFADMKNEIKKLREELDEVRGIAEEAESAAEEALEKAEETLEKAEEVLEKAEEVLENAENDE